MTWKKTELRRLVADAVSPVAGPAGFRYKATSQGFVRAIDGGHQNLMLSIVDHNPLFDFAFTMTIRLEAVQDITNRFSGSPPKYHGITLTSMTQLEFLGLPDDRGYRVRSESELAAVLPEVVALVKDRVLPFFDEYRDLASLNRGLNPDGAEAIRQLRPPDRRAFDTSNQPYRAMAGVTVAYLVRDPRLADLITTYRSQISGAHEDDRQKFEALVEHVVARN